MSLELQFICLAPPAKELMSSYSLILKSEFPLSGNELRITALVWHSWNDEEERMPMEPAWWTISPIVFSPAKMSQTGHIHFWNLFQALGNRSGKGTRRVYTFSARRNSFMPALSKSRPCQSHLFNLLREYRNTVMTYSWVILFRWPNFFFKRIVSTQSTLLLTLVEMWAFCIVYIICYQIFLILYLLSPVSMLA